MLIKNGQHGQNKYFIEYFMIRFFYWIGFFLSFLSFCLFVFNSKVRNAAWFPERLQKIVDVKAWSFSHSLWKPCAAFTRPWCPGCSHPSKVVGKCTGEVQGSRGGGGDRPAFGRLSLTLMKANAWMTSTRCQDADFPLAS